MAITAFEFAYKLLGLRLRSVFEMEKRLREKGFEKEIIDQVIKKLEEQGYLDDGKFTEAWIHDRINLQPRGSFLISRELKEKGVASELIEKKLSELLPIEKELEMAKELADRKIKIIKNREVKLPKEKIYQMMAAFLQGKGFSGEVIREAIDKTGITRVC